MPIRLTGSGCILQAQCQQCAAGGGSAKGENCNVSIVCHANTDGEEGAKDAQDQVVDIDALVVGDTSVQFARRWQKTFTRKITNTLDPKHWAR